MKMTIVVSAQILDEAGKIVPGHDFHLEVPGQSEEMVETFINEFTKFGTIMWKKARQAK